MTAKFNIDRLICSGTVGIRWDSLATTWMVLFGVVMKPKTKILFLLFGLIFPYMGFLMYRALVHPENPFPKWFLYAAPCYFVGSMALFVFLRKKILASASPLGLAEQNAQRLAAARSVRRMGYIW